MSKSDPKPIQSIKLKAIRRFFGRFGSTLYLVIIAACLALALLIVLQLINSDNSLDEVDKSLTDFDQETMELLRKDETTSKGSNVELPNGRINPFE